MESKPLSEYSNEELLAESKQLQSFSKWNAFFIGFFIGIVLFSIYNSTFGFLMLIPLFFIYKLVNDPKNKRKEEVKKELKVRNL